MAVRKNAFKMTKTEQDLYIAAVEALIVDGSYGSLVSIHADMSHRMHDMGETTRIGVWRFLSWHRAYLIRFEELLVRKASSAFVPYLHWTDGCVPDWLDALLPTVNSAKVERSKSRKPLADQARIDTVMAATDYFQFTYQLEQDPHNRGHVTIGKTMSRVPSAPSDPIFWMHHGEVDRVWAEWQAKNPGKGPILSGKDAVMDPWPEDVAKLASIKKLGYSYDPP